MKNINKLLEKSGLSRRRVKVIVREMKEVARIAIGAIMLGGIIKEDWPKIIYLYGFALLR